MTLANITYVYNWSYRPLRTSKAAQPLKTRIDMLGVRWRDERSQPCGKNNPSRAMANGTREPERIEPFNAAKMEIMAAILTAPAPRDPRIRRIISPATRSVDATRAGWQYIKIREIGQQIDRNHREGSDYQSARKGLLRISNFPGDHTDVIPTVVSPERRDECREETGNPTRSRDGALVICSGAGPTSEPDQNYGHNEPDLYERKHHLNVAADPNSEVVDERQHGNHAHRKNLTIANFERMARLTDGQRNDQPSMFQFRPKIRQVNEETRWPESR